MHSGYVNKIPKASSRPLGTFLTISHSPEKATGHGVLCFHEIRKLTDAFVLIHHGTLNDSATVLEHVQKVLQLVVHRVRVDYQIQIF